MDFSFGTWIKRRRKALDLTQQELAQRVGCSVSLIFKIESDERRPSRQIAELLARHLEIPPEQRETFLKVARQERAADQLEALSPVSRSAPAPISQPTQTALPVPLTSILGREHELHMIIQQIQAPACRLLTLTGPGGVGKTRLALEAAHQLRDVFEDGVCFVSLAGTSSPEWMIPAIADAMDLPFSGTADLRAQLFHFLHDKHFLIVLDNLEHLLSGVEQLDELLQAARGIKLLATSREALNLRAEWVFEVQGLPIPSTAELEALESNSAAALFLQRARQVKMNFKPTAEDLAAIAQICKLVDGLPLGLELAATWITTLSCAEIAREIERGLDFLSTSQRDIPERHRSLQAVFNYSWNLLPVEEQTLLKALSVFRGGFQREGAEQVAGATLPLLSSLMGKSFLRRTAPGQYSQHELIRQFAALRLHENVDEESSVRDRHASYYLGHWKDSELPLKSSQQGEQMQSLIAEIDNFRAAWDWAVTRGQFEQLGGCLRSLILVYDVRGWYAEGIERVGSIVRLLTAENVQPPHRWVPGLALALQGWFAFRRGQLHEARDWFDRSLEIIRPLNDQRLSAEVLSLFGPVLTSMGEIEKALQSVREGLQAARASGDPWRIAYALMMQGGILAGSGRYEEALASSRDALTHFRGFGDLRSTVVTLNTLGFALMQLARHAEARQFLQESLTLVTPASDPWSAGTAYGNLGIVELAQGNAGEAQTLLQKSVELFTDLGMKGDMALYLTYLGEAVAVQKKMGDAEQHWLDALRIAGEARALPTALAALVRLAQLYADRGDLARAYSWAKHVAAHSASWQESKDRAQQLIAQVEATNSKEQLESLVNTPASLPDPLIQ